jgi:hypothetical protein
MKSHTLASFWTAYRALDQDIRRSARKSYRLWEQNPFHPSLRFKCINHEENMWSVRITHGCRAIGIMDGDTLTWFWIGSHDKYEDFFS